MKGSGVNRRRHPRYNTEMEIYFEVRYDINVRVEFRVIDGDPESKDANRYFGLCNNVSAEGLLMVSKKQLIRGDLLALEVYDSTVKDPIGMEGEVRWCEKCPGPSKEHDMFYAGIQIVSVSGRSVADTVFFDKKNKVVWSAVLESIFGTYESIKKR